MGKVKTRGGGLFFRGFGRLFVSLGRSTFLSVPPPNKPPSGDIFMWNVVDISQRLKTLKESLDRTGKTDHVRDHLPNTPVLFSRVPPENETRDTEVRECSRRLAH